MNVHTCEICGKPTRDYDVVHTPFYFQVLPGYDNDAWGKHSNEAKVCDTHVQEYDWPVYIHADTSGRGYYRNELSPRGQMEREVIGITEQRKIADGVKPDYFFAT